MNKKILFTVLTVAFTILLVSSCKTGTYSQTSASEDVAFIKLMSSSSLGGKQVQVTINNGQSFSAVVNKVKKTPLKQKTYRIASGRSNIKIHSKGKLIWNQDVFVSQQSTRVIVL